MNKTACLLGFAISTMAVPAFAQVTTPGVGFGSGVSGIVNSAGGSSAAIGGGTMGPNSGGAVPGGGSAGFGGGTLGPNNGFAVPGGASGAIGAGTVGPGALSAFPGASQVGLNGSSAYSTGTGSPIAPAPLGYNAQPGGFAISQSGSNTYYGNGYGQPTDLNALNLLAGTGYGGGPNIPATAQPGNVAGQWAANTTVGQPSAIPTGSGFVQILPGAQNVPGTIQQPSFTNALQPGFNTNTAFAAGTNTGGFTTPVAAVNPLGTLTNPNGR